MLESDEDENKIKEDQEQNHQIKIEEIDLDPERRLFEDELKKNFSREDIDHYFDLITNNNIIAWENKLFESKLSIRDFSNVSDPDILDEKSDDIKTIKLIKGDIDRTRVIESLYMNNFKEYEYQVLIYYINKNNISYKQGLNEICGPFILLKEKLKISFSQIYKIFVCFIDKFLTNYFHEKEFFSLRSGFSLINLLLRFHEPNLFHKFDLSLISPDLYATSWIITLFSNKCALSATYYLWDKLILFDDSLFPFFFIVALLIYNKDKFLDKNVDSSVILSILSNLRVDSTEEVNILINLATEIRDKTPNSFYILSNKLEIFKYNSENLKTLYKEYKPDKMLAMPVFANELFCILYRDKVGCPDENCENFLTNKKFNELSNCIFCRNNDLRKKIKKIIFDLRIFENESINKVDDSFPGYLPNTLRITHDELRDKNFPLNIIEKYKEDKDNYHFIIITSETSNFLRFEKDFYIEKERKVEKLGIYYKSDKQIDINKVKQKFDKNRGSKKEYLLLKEFDNFVKFIDELNRQEFKYVSYIYDGYKGIHSFAKKYKIDLLDHGKKCFLCKEEKRNSSKFSFW